VDVFLQFTVVGIATGCIYALTATGLTVTYITSGIFNFAHGAVGMIAAFAYWELAVEHGWPQLPAVLAVLLVLAPIMGLLIEQLMRRLHGAPTEVTLVITLGVLLALIGVAQTRWDPGQARVLTEFFPGEQVRIFGINVTYHELIVMLTTVAVVIGLRLFLYRTRAGIALRAVVDAPDVAALNGAAPDRVSQMGWVIGAMLAALAGVLLAPITGVHPAMGAEILTAAFVVVVIGGLGSFWGVVWAALIVGVVRGLTVYFYPAAAEASMYLLMVLVLLVRPRGLFGERIQRFE
jgi:branched-chain amino acid transport system permease protein